MGEVYVSVDIEADGPCPGLNSMLSIGCVAFDARGDELGSFSANLERMEEATPDKETMDWWATQGDAWEASRKHIRPPEEVMLRLSKWLESLPCRRPVFVGYPAGFDFTYVYWYFHKFLGRCPFGFQALDIKSFAMAKLGRTFRKTTKSKMPKEWFGDDKHTHIAVEDAREQGKLFFAALGHGENEKCASQ